MLRRFLAYLVEHDDAVKSLIVMETGAPVSGFVLQAQVSGPLQQMESMLDLYMKLPEIEDNPLPLDERINPFGGFVQSLRHYVPVGVVAAISAYNFPLHISLWKVVTALATGNCVVLRPSPLTPLSTLALSKAAVAAGLPADVLHILAESGPEGAQLLTTAPPVDMVSFTGSTGVGSIVAGQACRGCVHRGNRCVLSPRRSGLRAGSSNFCSGGRKRESLGRHDANHGLCQNW